MIIYFDGGQNAGPKNIPRKDKCVTSTYGVLLHNGQEEPIEKHGKYVIPLKYNSIYEHIAFLEAFKVIKENNLNYKEVSFYTDSEDIAYAQTYLHKDNFMNIKADKFLVHLNQALDLLDMKKNKDEIIDCLLNSRFFKLKSHTKKFTVDNVRVDYLAKSAFKEENPISYEKFIACSFFKHSSLNDCVSFNLPFMPKNKKTTIKI